MLGNPKMKEKRTKESTQKKNLLENMDGLNEMTMEISKVKLLKNWSIWKKIRGNNASGRNGTSFDQEKRYGQWS